VEEKAWENVKGVGKRRFRRPSHINTSFPHYTKSVHRAIVPVYKKCTPSLVKLQSLTATQLAQQRRTDAGPMRQKSSAQHWITALGRCLSCSSDWHRTGIGYYHRPSIGTASAQYWLDACSVHRIGIVPASDITIGPALARCLFCSSGGHWV